MQQIENFTEFLSRFENIWIWSDTHFHHSKVIQYGARPFSSVEEMDLAMEMGWKETVGPNDLIINCGDVCFGGNQHANKIIDRCPGYKLLIAGNHDYKTSTKIRNLNFDIISLREEFIFEDESYILTHKPLPINQLGTSYNIHGHIHHSHYTVNGVRSPFHICVSVEHTNYRPILLTDICNSLKKQIIFDEV